MPATPQHTDPSSPASCAPPSSAARADRAAGLRVSSPTTNGRPSLVGEGLRVPLVTGEWVPYADLDHAASTPALAAVRDTIEEILPWYSSVHRGTGLKSQVTTRLYERARECVRRFAGVPADHAVLFTRNTTDAMNLLARALPPDTTVVVFDSEHHASLLPWRGNVIRLAPPTSPQDAAAQVDAALQRSSQGPRLLCVTGASNVTGERWPVEELTRLAHAHHARVALDAAQLAPHEPLDVAALDVDYVAFSGHKLYAPYGAGVLTGRADWLEAAEPYLAGGGATRNVGDTDVVWAGVPDRHEAGSPNVLGAVALAAACETLRAAGPHRLAAEEAQLLTRLRRGLAEIPGVTELRLWEADHPRLGMVSFTVDGWDAGSMAVALSAEFGIGVRAGRFCAHRLVRHLVACGDTSSAVRASIGLGTTGEHVDRLVDAVRTLVTDGPAWTYALRGGELVPDPDPRPLPAFLA